MKTAIYPGSFNPWHKGHDDILAKALLVFDRVIVAQGINVSKANDQKWIDKWTGPADTKLVHYQGLLPDAIKDYEEKENDKIHAVIRGLRNGYDLQYEQNQQYWLEDLGLEIPIVYFVTHRNLGHISSTALRQIKVFKK